MRIRPVYICLIAGLALGWPAARAGEDLMPMHPGSYARVGTEDPYDGNRVISSLQPKPVQRPKLHVNQVRLKLPSLGSPTETRMQFVEVRETSPDGSLNFGSAKAMPAEEPAGIPGLVSPEELALDWYSFRDAEPALAPLKPLEKPAAPAKKDEPEDVSTLRRLDSLPDTRKPRKSFARIELPARMPAKITVPLPPAAPFRNEPQAVELPPALEPIASMPAEPEFPDLPGDEMWAPRSSSMPPVEVWSLEPGKSRLF